MLTFRSPIITNYFHFEVLTSNALRLKPLLISQTWNSSQSHGLRILRLPWLGNSMGNPGVFQANPYPYLRKPTPLNTGVGFHGYGSCIFHFCYCNSIVAHLLSRDIFKCNDFQLCQVIVEYLCSFHENKTVAFGLKIQIDRCINYYKKMEFVLLLRLRRINTNPQQSFVRRFGVKKSSNNKLLVYLSGLRMIIE